MWQDGAVQWENSGQWLYPRVRKFFNILETGRAMKVVQQWDISPGDVPITWWTEHFNTRQEYIDQLREEVSQRVKSQYPCPFWCWFNFSKEILVHSARLINGGNWPSLLSTPASIKHSSYIAFYFHICFKICFVWTSLLLLLCETAKMKISLYSQVHVELTWRKWEYHHCFQHPPPIKFKSNNWHRYWARGCSQEKLDFAMPHMFNLVSLERTIKSDASQILH